MTGSPRREALERLAKLVADSDVTHGVSCDHDLKLTRCTCGLEDINDLLRALEAMPSG